ncbi:hypothetical protein BC936DRAFT_149307 [Jimgerdemannia flammicorona]|uniref:Uncharacterized protein n=1 Tax=Jimgerdemannia flammicorona TaxID=994334 RepID=A0A433D141_9FUNG|nr:hypothetical protein BC936DRAFT_149307 [Jimgerdemannia flammicorona]
MHVFRTATLSRGVDIELVKKLETFFANHGFTNVQCNRVTCPIGWDGVVGDMRLKNVGFMMDALRPIILPAMGVSREEYEELTHGLAEQYGKFKTYGIWTIGYGLKPLKA